jgi:hypothetical protein
VPAGIVDRVAAELEVVDAFAPASVHRDVEPSRVELPWPAARPTGGRHGFLSEHRPAFDAAIRSAAAVLTAAAGPARRILVLGSEELMYLPLRLAFELAEDPLRRIMFQSTTRSPVHAIDRPGYPIRRRVDFQSAVIGPGLDEPDRTRRHVYNVCWPSNSTRATTDDGALDEADLIVVVDDGHALSGTNGVAQSICAATGVPVVLAVLTPRPTR